MYLVGKTGTGKSTLLHNLMADDLENGRGFALIDPHGDLSQYIADITPKCRTNDVIYFDPLDQDFAVGFNPLARVPIEQRSIATAAIISAFKNIWSDSWGPRLEYIFGNTLRLLLDVPNATLLHVPLVLAHEHYRKRLLKYCTDSFNLYYWTTEVPQVNERMWAEWISPVQNKVGQFAANPNLRAIFGQSSSTLDFDDIINSRKVLIAKLSKQMGEGPSHLLGALLSTAFAQAAERRATIPESDREDFTLYVDEFQNFATDTFASVLSEARKWRLNLVLANQFVEQLPESLKQGVLGNVGTLVVFRVGSQDAELLSKELGLPDLPGVSRQLTDTPNFQAWVKRVATDALSIKTLPVVTTGSRLDEVRRRTQSRYMRSRRAVERQTERIFN